MKLGPAKYALDRLFRPAEVRLKDGTDGPGPPAAGLPGVARAPTGCSPSGWRPTASARTAARPGASAASCCSSGDEAEVPLAECRMIEIRGNL